MRTRTHVFAAALTVTLLASFVSVTPAQAAPEWAVPKGVNLELSTGAVSAITPGPGGTFFIAGNFTTNDRQNPTNFSIGRWDGRTLQPIANTPSGTAFSLTFDTSTNSLYAGGYFTLGSTAYNIIRWSGSAWTGVADLDFGSASSLIDDDAGTLYVGGTFRQVNGVTGFGNIAALTSNGWSNLGAVFNDTVTSLALDNRNNLYVAGFFTRSNPSDFYFGSVAMLSRGTWSPLGATNGRVLTLAIGPGRVLYGHGNFTEASGSQTAFARMRLGSETDWQPVPAPPQPVTPFGASQMSFTANGALLLAIDGRIYSFAAERWSSIPGVFGGPIRLVVADRNGGLLAGGSFVSVDSIRTPGLAFRSASQPPPAPTGVGASRWSSRSIMVTWNRVTATPRVTGYRAECKNKSDRGGSTTTGLPLAEISVPGKGLYACRVAARNSVGWGPWSAKVQIRLP